MQNESYNSVAQRFCLAIIQKMSVYQEISECLFNNKILDWALKIFREDLISLKDFAFLYNFSSALILNMIYVFCKEKKEFLTSDKVIQLIQNLYVPLFSLAQHYSYTVFNILSIFSYLVNDFSKELEDCEFNVKIKEFLFEYQNSMNIVIIIILKCF